MAGRMAKPDKREFIKSATHMLVLGGIPPAVAEELAGLRWDVLVLQAALRTASNVLQEIGLRSGDAGRG
jgi:hypothetical protein